MKKRISKRIYNLLFPLLNYYENAAAKKDLIDVSKKKRRNGPIRVAFIVQMPELWDKQEPIYSAMKKDPAFIPEILVVPPYDGARKTIRLDYGDNYFIKEYEDSIPAYDGDKWINIGDKYDYVFLQRPYDAYLPKHLRSACLRKHTKCCYIPYGFNGSDAFNKGNTNPRFFRNIYFVFSESEHMKEELRKIFKEQKEIHHIEFLGYPVLEGYFSIESNNKYENVLWTPRWSYDKKIGGSRFMEYKDIIPKIKEEYSDDDLTFRPHPMLFDEMIFRGWMTESEIHKYLKHLNEIGIQIDLGEPIFKTIKNTDILITDYSTIIMQYFITGKPLIYCDAGIELNNDFKRISKGFYIAHNDAELMQYIRQLKEGYDPLMEVRQKIVSEELIKYKGGADLIVDRIKRDASM